MKEIIKKWRQFMEEWKKRPEKYIEIEGERRMYKPDFFDFMEWLSKTN